MCVRYLPLSRAWVRSLLFDEFAHCCFMSSLIVVWWVRSSSAYEVAPSHTVGQLAPMQAAKTEATKQKQHTTQNHNITSSVAISVHCYLHWCSHLIFPAILHRCSHPALFHCRSLLGRFLLCRLPPRFLSKRRNKLGFCSKLKLLSGEIG